jgi:hypothetical protein
MLHISEKEITAVSQLPVEKRYHYFLKRFADTLECYALQDQMGTYALSEIDGHLLFSLWPAPEFATLCLNGEWSGYQVVKIDLEDSIFSEISEKGYLINVFPIEEKTGFVVDSEEFNSDLDAELEKYA